MPSLDRPAIRRRFDDVRERTLALVAPLPWVLLRKQHIPILSPMVWDVGHIGNFEEMWLLHRLRGRGWMEPGLERMFDPVTNPRPTREALPLPARPELFRYLSQVRERVLDDLHDPAAPGSEAAELLAGGFVYEMVAEHEEQHQETLLQAMQAMAAPCYTPALRRPTPHGRPVDRDMVEIPAGPFLMGHPAQRSGFAYDNEREAHEVDLPTFRIDRTPVTNEDYLAFVEGGGYDRREHWSAAGWRWRQESAARAPLYWLPPGGAPPEGTEERADRGGWRLRRLDRVLPLDPAEPVTHVSYWEAEAYARSVGKRLPSEAEWEKAALWDPRAGRARRYPWGDAPPSGEHANLDQLAFGPAQVGAYPAGASAYGCHQMVGDTWEWTASDFTGYPGFRAFPYAEYSEIFFGGDSKVLRGGSWATRPAVARGTFRNWDLPIRRQIFTGIRCAVGDGFEDAGREEVGR
ncbi:MAG TPA: ergothioneine biosynthesis protein EgtB [Thermoanaerobaculia bacterium]|nr:ergothioneine biosynthesis protein EgtB [Thermoanaerobaculia bacterium]